MIELVRFRVVVLLIWFELKVYLKENKILVIKRKIIV